MNNIVDIHIVTTQLDGTVIPVSFIDPGPLTQLDGIIDLLTH